MDRDARDEARTLIRRLIEEPGDTFDPRDAERVAALVGNPRGWFKRMFWFETIPVEIGPWQVEWLSGKCLELRRVVAATAPQPTTKMELWQICFETDKPAAIMREETATREYRLWRSEDTPFDPAHVPPKTSPLTQRRLGVH